MNTTATRNGYSSFQRTLAREGLAEHDNDCCTPGARCWMAEGLERIVNSTASAVYVDAEPDRPMSRGNGGSNGYADRYPVATDKQLTYIRSMIDQLADVPAELPAIIIVRDMVKAELATGNVMTKRTASDVIGKLKPLVDVHRGWKAQQAKTQRAAAPVAPAESVTPGIYKLGDDIVKVNASRSTGPLYATVLTQVDGKNRGTFEYAPGLIRKLTPAHRLTLAQASEFGHLYHFCACCGRELTHPDSVDAGIGPVCRANL